MDKNDNLKKIRDDFEREVGADVIYIIENMDTNTLLEVGQAVGSTDNAVTYFDNKKHPEFYQNRAALIKSILKTYEAGKFNHQDQIHQIIKTQLDGKPVERYPI